MEELSRTKAQRHKEEKPRKFSHQALLYELCPTRQEGTRVTRNYKQPLMI